MVPKSLAAVVMARPRAEPALGEGAVAEAFEIGSDAFSDAVPDVVDSRAVVFSRLLGSPLQPETTSPAALMVAAMVRRRALCVMSWERFCAQSRAPVAGRAVLFALDSRLIAQRLLTQ